MTYRVRYTGAEGLADAEWGVVDKTLIGIEGTVSTRASEMGGGKWDNGREWLGYLKGNLEVIADPVNQPEHYTTGEIECIDAIKAQMTADQFAGYLRGNIVNYLWRYEHKGGAESLDKAEWYLKRLIQEVRSDA